MKKFIKRILKKIGKVLYTILWIIALPGTILNGFHWIPYYIEIGRVPIYVVILGMLILFGGIISLIEYIKHARNIISRIIHLLRGAKWHQCKYCGTWTYEPDYRCYKNPITNF